MQTRHGRRAARRLVLLLALVLAAVWLLPVTARAGKTVRVGWYETPFNITGEDGRRSGYAYEYQRKLAAYTGWTYEYVEGTWPELMELLEAGELDLMSDVSFSPDRARRMHYADLPMGTETYYIFVPPESADVTSDSWATLNGKRVGVTRGSVQRDIYLKWAEQHGVRAELVETDGSEEDSLERMRRGEMDAFVTLDAYGDTETAVPVYKIGSSDFYFAVAASRTDLLAELNAAMSRIQDENKYYNQQLYEKYLKNPGTRYLTPREKEWLASHGPIRVGYQDNYLAFCAADPETGELTGALKDSLAYASTALENGSLSFTPVAYPTAAAAVEAMRKGEVDCVFPANLTPWDCETVGVTETQPIMATEMDAVVRAGEQKDFLMKENVTVAVNQGNTNYERFLADHFPQWDIRYFPDTPAGLRAVARGEADCVIISNYRFSNVAKLCQSLRLERVYTGVDMDYAFAVREGSTQLYGILSKAIGAVPSSVVHAALTYYSAEEARQGVGEIILDNLLWVLLGAAVVLLVFLALLLRNIRAERKVREEHHLVDDLNKRVYVDALTSVRNKGGFDDYISRLQEELERGEAGEFAVGVFDCDDLKSVNDRNGHDKGDLYLQAASRLICRVFQHSPVFRIGGDEFAVVLRNDDFNNRADLIRRFEEEERTICAGAENPWEMVSVAQGIAVYDPDLDAAVNDTVRRADEIMYGNKRGKKNADPA